MKAKKIIFIVCSICCFAAILKLPIEYYTFLRTIVSLGALPLIYVWTKQKNYALTVVFILVLILFNPLFPIYLYRKSIWIPLDIITGLLFLIIAFYKKIEPVKQEEKAAEILPVQKTYSRDRIVSAKREIH
jgi:succinate-acetate transporter protein